MAEEIVIKIAVSAEKANKSLKDAKGSVDELSAAEKKLKNIQEQVAFAASEEGKEFAALSLKLKKLKADNLAAADSSKKLSKDLKDNTANAGLNNAIVTELSRGASDLRFGFTAVSNNLAQLIDLFRASSKAAGGFFNALKKIFSPQALILIGVQLLISYGDQIYNFFTRTNTAAEKLKETMEGLNAEIEGQRVELLGYVEVLKDAYGSEEARLNALQELETVIPGLTDANNAQRISLEELTLEVEAYIRQQRLRAELDAIVEANAELFAERERVRTIQSKLDAAARRGDREEQIKIFQEELSFLEKVFVESDEARKAAGGEGIIERLREQLFGKMDPDFDISAFFAAQTKDTVEAYDVAVSRIVEIEKLLKANRKNRNEGTEKDNQLLIDLFERGDLDLTKAIQKAQKKAAEIEATNEQEKLDIREEFAKKEADRRLSVFEENESQRLEDFKKQADQDLEATRERAKGKKNADELIQAAEAEHAKAIIDAEAKFNQSILDAKAETAELKLAIEDEYITRRILLADKEAREIAKIERKIENAEIDRLSRSEFGLSEYFTRKEEQLKEDIRNQDIYIKTTEMSAKDEAIARQELTSMLNQQADLQLEKEIFVIEQKEAVNAEYISFISGIGGIMNKLAGENEALQNAALIVEKGAAIADIVIRTQADNAIARSQAVASMGTLTPLAESLILRNNIGSGIAIANILATTLTSFKKPSGSAETISSNIQAPSFNVVGQSTTDQLLTDVRGGLSDVKLNVNLNEINDGNDTLNFIGSEANVFPEG